MAAISGRLPDVIVEYDCKGGRKEKLLPAHEAKRFYVAKLKAGKNPKLKKADK